MQARLADEGSILRDTPPSPIDRSRARAVVWRVDALMLDLTGIEAASPSFLDELFGRLSEKYGAVNISGARSDLHPLIDRVIARRGLESRFKVTAEA